MKAFYLLLMSALVGCSSGSASEDTEAPSQYTEATPVVEPVAVQQEYVMPSHLVIVGDSIMAGATVGQNIFLSDYTQTTAHQMAEIHKMRVTNLSLSGQNMRGAMVDNDISGGINYVTSKDSAVWIQLGVNDFVWTFSTLEEYRLRYTALLDSIVSKGPSFRKYCVVPTRASYKLEVLFTNSEGYSLEDYRQVVRDIASSGACTLVDADLWFTDDEVQPGSAYMPDGLHMSGLGHQRYMFLMTLTIRYIK